ALASQTGPRGGGAGRCCRCRCFAGQKRRSRRRPGHHRLGTHRRAARQLAHACCPLGTVGPLAWPGAFEDVIGYTLWPKQYGGRLGAHGIGDVLSTAFAPRAAIAARTKQARADGTAAEAAPACGSVELTANDWPIA